MWEIYFTRQAQKDARKIANLKMKEKVKELLSIIEKDPYAYPPKYEILKGRLSGFVSRRINEQHRLIYQVFEDIKIIKILKMWTHYE